MTEWNRNVSGIYEISGEKIISKEHQKLIFLRREQFFYDLFQEGTLIKTPKIYSINGLNLQTRFIETEPKNIYKTPEEWAKVHSHYLENPIVDNELIIKHDIEEVLSYISGNLDIFDSLGSVVEKKISRVRNDLRTILHGDLQQKNMVTFQQENYYFDFELGGVGHPARDIASMIISNPNEKENLLKIYKGYASFDYPELREDVDAWLMARAAQLYIIFDKRKGSERQKKPIKEKLSRIIEKM